MRSNFPYAFFTYDALRIRIQSNGQSHPECI